MGVEESFEDDEGYGHEICEESGDQKLELPNTSGENPSSPHEKHLVENHLLIRWCQIHQSSQLYLTKERIENIQLLGDSIFKSLTCSTC